MVHFILKKEIGKQMDTCNMMGFINDLETEKNSIVCQLQMQLIRCWTDNRKQGT